MQMTPSTTPTTARQTPRPHGTGARARGGTRRSPPVAQPAEPLLEPCAICPDADPALACDTCIVNARQRRERGMEIDDIARVMQIDTDRVWLLLALHDATVELDALKVDTVPTEGIRALIRAACHPANATFGLRDDVEHIEHGRMSDANLENLVGLLRANTPTTLSAIAAELGYSQVSLLSRKVGALPKSGRLGSKKEYNDTISVEDASEIVRILGLAPAQVDWL
jgi:hypothetical protein